MTCGNSWPCAQHFRSATWHVFKASRAQNHEPHISEAWSCSPARWENNQLLLIIQGDVENHLISFSKESKHTYKPSRQYCNYSLNQASKSGCLQRRQQWHWKCSVLFDTEDALPPTTCSRCCADHCCQMPSAIKALPQLGYRPILYPKGPPGNAPCWKP